MDWLKPKTLAGWMVALPMAVVLIYYAFFAADRYVSESVISVRASGENVNPIPGLAMLAGVSPPAREDVLYLQAHIHSLDMLKHLDGKFDLRLAYGQPLLDPVYRLFPGVSQEWFHWYFQNRVELEFDEASSLLTVRVDGFTPEFAQAVNAEILAQSERFVNEISHKLAREQMAFADEELRKARDRYQQAKSRMVAFQNKHGLLDPQAQAQATATLSTQLEGDLARKEAELKALLSYLQEDSHQVVALRNEVAALKAQLAEERARVAGSGSNGRLNALAAQFQDYILDAGFAEDAYKLALATVESTRIEATRKLKGVVVVEAPTRSETAEYPQRAYNLITLLVALSLIYGITRLVIATLHDHRD
ncbi:MAG: capsular biosynthesis protein [Pseudomonadota bacterium]